jgi:hypothetical protein
MKEEEFEGGSGLGGAAASGRAKTRVKPPAQIPGVANMPIVIDDEAAPVAQIKTPTYDNQIAATDDAAFGKRLHSGRTTQKHRWVFYGTLLSLDNVNDETMSKIPKLVEFIYHLKTHGTIIFYAQFERGIFARKEEFLKVMSKHGITIDPASIPDGLSQPAQYGITKGRVCTDRPVDYHWRTPSLQRLVDNKSADDNAGGCAQAPKAPKQDNTTGGYAKQPKPAPRDYTAMTMGAIIKLIEKQDDTIRSQRKHIRTITEGGNHGDYVALQDDNDELVQQNKAIKAELRELRRKNDALLAENKRLKASIAKV